MVSMIDLLSKHARRAADSPLFSFLDEAGSISAELHAGQVEERVRNFAVRLGKWSSPGSRAMLVFPTGPEFLIAFLGCLAAGVVAVPVYPPGSRRGLSRLEAIALDASPSLLLTTARQAARLQHLLAGSNVTLAPLWLHSEDLEHEAEPETGVRLSRSTEVAFLQYTSGSTSRPKGVIVTHANLLHNERQIREAFAQSERSIVVSWLPLYHDMGLIGGLLQPLFCGGRCVLLAPTTFLKHPATWLQAVSRFRATTSGGPNFAYELAADRVKDEEAADLDLSSWELAFNGAEPVRRATMEKFSRRFAPWGFRHQSFYPCYGLAEATLFVAGGRAGAGFHGRSFERKALGTGEAAPADGDTTAAELVSCGFPWGEQELAIVAAGENQRLRDGMVGEIWVRGPNVTLGYWRQPEAPDFSRRLAGDETGQPWLATGDLGFVMEGELYVTGRLKDLIIQRGRNHYPQDLEQAAQESHPALSAGLAAAYAVETEGGERLTIACEVERGAVASAVLEDCIRQAVAEIHEIAVDEVLLVRLGGIPRTSSGKVQRSATRRLALAGELPLWNKVPRARRPASAEAGDHSEPAELATARRLAAAAVRRPVSDLGADRPLTALGLDSLSAVELQRALAESCGVEVELSALLSGLSARELAAEIAVSGSPIEKQHEPAPPGASPLSPGQQLLWLESRQQPLSTAYNLTFVLHLEGPLVVAALSRALSALRARHETLRTLLVSQPGVTWPLQRVEPMATSNRPPLSVLDLEALTPASREKALNAHLRALNGRAIELERGPDQGFKLVRHSASDHLLVLSIHHLWADGWSLRVVARDLGELYAGALLGGAELPPLPRRFADYAWGEQQRASRGELEAAARRLVSEISPPPALELATDRARGRASSGRAARHRWMVAPELWQATTARAAQEVTTPFVWLLGAWQLALARWADHERFWLALPLANRSHAGVADLVGCFVHLGLVAADTTGRPSGRELVQRAAVELRRAQRGQDLPFDRLAAALGESSQGGSRSPLLRAVIALLPQVEPRFPDLRAAFEEVPPQHTKLELALLLEPRDRGLMAVLEFDTDLYDATTLRRLGIHFERLLAALIHHPERPSHELEMLSAAERHQLRLELQGDSIAVPFRSVPTQVLAGRRLYPDAIALVDDCHHWSFEQVSTRALHLAARLLEHGVTTDDVVAIALPRSAGQITATFAVWLTGATYLPLAPELPAERWRELCGETRVKLALGRGEAEAVDLGAPWLDSNHTATELEAEGLVPIEPDQLGLAYLLFTSGSTGSPKGVEVHHGGLANLVAWHCSTYGLGAGHRASQFASLGFDASIWEIWPVLSSGGTVVVVPEEIRASPRELVAWLASRAITSCFLPTPVAEATLSLPWPLPMALERLLTGGDRLRRAAPRSLPFALINHYGPTEVSVVATAGKVGANEQHLPAIGRPITHLSAHVLSREGALAPLSGVGALVLAGRGLARGYHRRPAWTAELFQPDPLGPPGERCYRTGDRARRRGDGSLEFLGRADRQVKVRGVRIELGEIEAALCGLPGIHAAAVHATEVTGGTLLSAYYVAEASPPPRPDELRTALASRLPEAMVPTSYQQLSALPLTANGKLDRRALPPVVVDEEPAPEGALEQVLCGLATEVLGQTVGPRQNLFERGGHSLRLAELLQAIDETLGHAPTLAQLVATPNVRGIAAVLRADSTRSRQVETTAQLLVEVAQLSEAEASWRLETQLEVGS